MSLTYAVRVDGRRRLAWMGCEGTSTALWDEHWSGITLGSLLQDVRGDAFFLELFERYLPRGPMPVLEGGCGLGQWVSVLADKGWQIVGLDFARETLRSSRSASRGIKLVVGDVRSAPFGDSSLGGYVSLGVVEHFFDGPSQVLEECRRLLAPGARLLVSVPYLNPIRRLKLAIRHYPALSGDPDRLRDEFYQYAFSVGEFSGILRDGGFRVVAKVPYDARKGLSAEVPLAGRIIRRLRDCGTDGEAAADVSCERGAGHRMIELPQSRLRAVAEWLSRRTLLRRFAGHMMLYVAEKVDCE